MEVFTQIDGAKAIVKLPKGVYKQVQLYHRKGSVFIPHSGGYVEVRRRELGGDAFTTGHPDIKLVEHDDLTGFHKTKDLNQDVLKWKGS